MTTPPPLLVPSILSERIMISYPSILYGTISSGAYPVSWTRAMSVWLILSWVSRFLNLSRVLRPFVFHTKIFRVLRLIFGGLILGLRISAKWSIIFCEVLELKISAARITLGFKLSSSVWISFWGRDDFSHVSLQCFEKLLKLSLCRSLGCLSSRRFGSLLW